MGLNQNERQEDAISKLSDLHLYFEKLDSEDLLPTRKRISKKKQSK